MKEICNNCIRKNNWIGCFECEGEMKSTLAMEGEHGFEIMPNAEEVIKSGFDFKIPSKLKIKSMKTHELKILPQYFNAVADGSKPFEIRKNDRGFEVGDRLILKEYRPLMNIENRFSGDKIEKEVSYILEGGQYGLKEGYCILGLKPTFKSETLKALLDVGLDAKAIQECYERYRWHIDYYKDSIKLKNIDLTRISKKEQLKKSNEERKELLDALLEDEFYSNVDDKDKKEIKDHIIEEFWDLVQSHLGLIKKHGISAEEVQAYYPKHLEKLKHRPRSK